MKPHDFAASVAVGLCTMLAWDWLQKRGVTAKPKPAAKKPATKTKPRVLVAP